MDFFEMSGDYGNYEFTLSDIQSKGIGYVEIKAFSDFVLALNEAKEVLITYHPKEMYLKLSGNIPYSEIPSFSLDRYAISLAHFKQNKDYKIRELSLENRYDFPMIYNQCSRSILGRLTMNDGKVVRMMREYQMGFVEFTNRYVASYIYKGNTIYFLDTIPQMFEKERIIQVFQKVLNKFIGDVSILVFNKNKKVIDTILELGFVKKEEKFHYYKVGKER